MHDALTEAVHTLRHHHRHLEMGRPGVEMGRVVEARDILAHALGHQEFSDSRYRKLDMWHQFACEQTR